MPKLFSPNLDLIVAEGLNLVVEYLIHVGLLLPNRPGTSKRNSGLKCSAQSSHFQVTK